MKILAIRTDKPEAELYLYDGEEQIDSIVWPAHRELAETIHMQLSKLLNKSSISLDKLEGIICFRGPGSFTGLRIGLSVANALAHSFKLPVVATSGDDWIKTGIQKINDGENDKIAIPEYGAPAKTTLPKK